jgi:hypothetical protein
LKMLLSRMNSMNRIPPIFITLLFLYGWAVHAQDGLATCSEQSSCIHFTKEKVQGGPCSSSSSGGCDIKVCLTTQYGQGSCTALATHQLQYVCTRGATATPTTCSNHVGASLFQFVDTDDRVSNVPTNAHYCVIVQAGENAYFSLRDSSQCNSPTPTSYANLVTAGTAPHTAHCHDNSASFHEPGTCSGIGNAKHECLWTVPTSSTDCTTLTIQPPMGGGDPHYRTWSGQHYVYHGVCDLVLLHTPGLDIHVRTRARRDYAFITGVAVRIGEHIWEVDAKARTYYINQVDNAGGLDMRTTSSVQHTTFAGFPLDVEQSEDHQRRTYTLHMGMEEAVVIKTWKDFITVTIRNGSKDNFGDSVGLMGSFGLGYMMGRDGTRIYNPHNQSEINLFGQEWQVNDDDPILFQRFAIPQYPQQCQLPQVSSVVPSSQQRSQQRRLGEFRVTHAMARDACALVDADNVELCIYDVLATNDVTLAGAYY